MNILDENIIESQCLLLRSWGIKIRRIGYDVGQQGLQDKEIISFGSKYKELLNILRGSDGNS